MNLKTKIRHLEDQRYSFFTGFLALYSIIFIRNIFESAFEDRQIFGFTSEMANSFYMLFVHYPLFYLSIFVWLLIFLVLITKENYFKIARVLVIGFSVIIIVPFIDIIISKGSGYKLTYLTGFEAHPVAYKFFDFSRDMLQVTWGQRIEILLAVLGLFGYIFIKTKNVYKGFISAIIVYLIFFIHGLLPNAIAKIPSILGAKFLDYRTIITGGILSIDSQNYAVIFCLSIFLAGVFIIKMTENDNLFTRHCTGYSLLPIILLLLGMIYGILLILPFYKFFIYSPIFYLIIILAIITVHLANVIFLPFHWKVVARPHPALLSNTFCHSEPKAKQSPIYLIAILFFSISLSPIFLIFIFLSILPKLLLNIPPSPPTSLPANSSCHCEFFRTGTSPVPTLCSLIFAFLAGFSIIMQSDTFTTIIPWNKQAVEIKARKLSAWDDLLNGNYTRALSEYSIIYSLTNDNNIFKNIGQCYLNLGEIDRAIETLSKVKTPDYQTIISLAWAYSQQGKTEKVIQVYQTGIEHNLELAEFHIKIAQILARSGDKWAMEKSLRKAAIYGAPQYQIYQLEGDYYLSQKDYYQALKMYNKSLFYNSRAPAPYVGKGKALYALGDYKSALKEFKKALKFDPNNDAIYNNIGVMYMLLGDRDKAIRNFKKSVEINPAYAEAYFNLGLVAEKDNKLDSALVMYETTLKINPQFMPAKQAIERIGKKVVCKGDLKPE